MSRTGSFLPLLALILPVSAPAADAPALREVRVQQVGDTTYVHLKLTAPKDAQAEQPEAERPRRRRSSSDDRPADSPRLVSPDGKVVAIYNRPARPVEPEASAKEKSEKPRRTVPVEGLEFVGKTKEQGAVKLVLIYPTAGEKGRTTWQETTLTIDLSKAKTVAIPAEARTRKAGPDPKKGIEPPAIDDIEGLWASAQVDYFDALQRQSDGFGFPSFAVVATARKYNVPLPSNSDTYVMMRKVAVTEMVDGKPRTVVKEEPVTVQRSRRTGESERTGAARLYEMFTGTAAIAESLALQRMRAVDLTDEGKRTIDIAKIQGIDIAEHPWEKMLAGKKPADEPLARLIPHDNYYASFKSLRKLLDFVGQVELPEGAGTRAWSVQGRDYRITERYARQLCLERSQLGKRVGGQMVKGIAVTGSDPYLREGSDVTVIFHVNRRELFAGALDLLIAETRKKHGDALKESKSTFLDVAIDSHVTPLREVSLHRAAFDDYVICSNSLAGLQRVVETHKGKRKRLADSLDFQYMRTVFRADDKTEDGFVFLSDAFIRQLAGPASKIKEKRRLEALTSLHMLTHGALFTAWETGKTPTAHREVLAGSNLKPAEVPMPEGKPAGWDATRQVAFSDTYNTIHFATPLVELPIDKATDAEQQQYNRFRLEYLGLWRQYFDPVGMRLSLSEKEAKVETYILPLVKNNGYEELRRITGGGTIGLDPNGQSKSTMFQLVFHLTSSVQARSSLFGLGDEADELGLGSMLAATLGPVGEWVHLRIDDSPAYMKFAELLERGKDEEVDVEEVMKLMSEVPAVLGFDVKNPITFGAALAALRTGMTLALPGGVTWEPLEKPYRDVPIVRVQASSNASRKLFKLDGEKKETHQPAVYYAMIDGGFYITLNEKMLRDLVDESAARKKGGKPIPVTGSLYVAPGAAKAAGPILRRALERRVREQALGNVPLWYVLQRCNLLGGKDAEKAETAYRYLGFVPVSPDGSAYEYRADRDEVVNRRHGTPIQPTPQKELAEGSPLAKLMERLTSARADLRFREDGIHTVVTIERVPPAK